MSCSSCMADVVGPVLNSDFQNLNNVELVRANESSPAEIACKVTCHDRNHTRYKYELNIDILDRQLVGRPPKRKIIIDNYVNTEYNFTITISTSNTCDHNNSETEIEYHIYVSTETPMIIAKCVVSYDPTGFFNKESMDVNQCSNLFTLAIIPYNHHTTALQTMTINEHVMQLSTTTSDYPPDATALPTNSVNSESVPSVIISTLSEEIPPGVGITGSVTHNDTCNCGIVNRCLPPNIYGPIIAILVILSMTETPLLIIFICRYFVCRKLKAEKPVEVITNHGYNNIITCEKCGKNNKTTTQTS